MSDSDIRVWRKTKLETIPESLPYTGIAKEQLIKDVILAIQQDAPQTAKTDRRAFLRKILFCCVIQLGCTTAAVDSLDYWGIIPKIMNTVPWVLLIPIALGCAGILVLATELDTDWAYIVQLFAAFLMVSLFTLSGSYLSYATGSNLVKQILFCVTMILLAAWVLCFWSDQVTDSVILLIPLALAVGVALGFLFVYEPNIQFLYGKKMNWLTPPPTLIHNAALIAISCLSASIVLWHSSQMRRTMQHHQYIISSIYLYCDAVTSAYLLVTLALEFVGITRWVNGARENLHVSTG